MNLSEKIYITRKARRYTQEELGYKIGVSRQTVSDWENGKYEPTLDNIRALSQVLEISFDVLLNEKVDLNNKDELNRALKNLDSDTKGKINNSFRYRIREYTITQKDYIKVIAYFVSLFLSIVGTAISVCFIKDSSVAIILAYIFGLIAFFLICIISLPISRIKYIKQGGYQYSFGTLSQTHLVIIGWSDAKFDRTVYVPVDEIDSMELAKDATPRHGKVIIKIKDRNKPMITNDIVEPQKLIDIFNNLETFIESPYGK